MRIFNFSAGPTMVPKTVMDRIQKEFTNYQALGVGIMELSHRTVEFSDIIDKTEANIRKLMKIGDEYAVCFIQGGASLQFSMIPMNLMKHHGFAEYIDTGYWSEKAICEAKKHGNIRIVASSKSSKYQKIPSLKQCVFDEGSSYVHVTTNNSVEGIQYHFLPDMIDGVPLIADMSTDIMTKKVDLNKFDLIYASTQKVLGASGLALVIIKKSLLERAEKKNLPTMLDYSTYVFEKSMHNTPPTFSIYILMLITDWLISSGGISAVDRMNTVKSDVIYEFIDSSNFYTNFVDPQYRSRVNIVFRTPSDILDELFLTEAEKVGLIGLKGHRSVEGLRASMYNAMPLEGVEALVDFMNDFESKHG